jgi:hypothetical protein
MSTAPKTQARNGLVLDDPDVVIEVTSGYFDVFAVGSETMGAAGSLHHLLRAGANQPVAGGISLPEGIDRLLAVPGPGAKFQTTRIDDWVAYVEDGALEETQDLIHDSLRSWFEQLVAERPAGAPKRLVAGEPAVAESGDWLACDHGIVVVELADGRLSLLGSAMSAVRSGESVIATHHIWLVADEGGSFKVTEQDEVEDAPLLIDAFVRTVRQLLLVRCESVLAKESASGAAMRGRRESVQLDDGGRRTGDAAACSTRTASAGSPPAGSERIPVYAAAKLIVRQPGY